MSHGSGHYRKCPLCHRQVDALFDWWQCDCGKHECCNLCRDAMTRRIPRRHRDGDCGLDAAFSDAMSKDD